MSRGIRIVAFSAHHANLRAAALVRSLEAAGYEVVCPAVRPRLTGLAEILWTMLPHCWAAATSRADLALGFKPHLNVCLPLMICWVRGIPAWIDVDDLDHAYRAGWVGRLIEIVQRPFPRWFQVVSYHNPKLRDFLVDRMGCWPGQLMAVRQGVDRAAFQRLPNPEEREALRARLGVGGRRVAVYAAHLNVACEIDAVLDIWALVAGQVADATLLVVGGGPRLMAARARAAAMGLGDRVVFVGAVDHGAVPGFLAAADVAVMYLRPRLVNEYRSSLKLREYLASGMRVACNDVGELRDFAAHTYQYPSDLPSFARGVASLLEGTGDGREHAARRAVLEELDWRVIAAEADRGLTARLGVGQAATPTAQTPPDGVPSR